ncbi:MAG: LytTR family DNA-binding domain-containing protein [Bacteroidia bacterium]|nr:LytTR family DNA-binding domain-containing protein [Bacteroidia bacterium]
MKSILRKLNEAYPDSANLKAFFWEALGVGAFIFLFLYFFRPFGIGQVQDDTLMLCLGFGLITFAVSLLFEIFIRFVLKIRKDLPSWTLGKWILTTTILISFIALANHAYLLYRYPSGPFHVGNLLFSFISTFAIGIFPIIFSGLVNQLRFVKKNNQHASEIQLPLIENHPAEKLRLSSANKKQSFEVELDKLLYLEAMQNYVLVYYVGESEIEKEILRTTLSQLDKELPDDHFYRSHRSFIVNLGQISKVKGNAQGLTLSLKVDEDLEVPVSRNKIKELKNRLSQKLVIHP